VLHACAPPVLFTPAHSRTFQPPCCSWICPPDGACTGLRGFFSEKWNTSPRWNNSTDGPKWPRWDKHPSRLRARTQTKQPLTGAVGFVCDRSAPDLLPAVCQGCPPALWLKRGPLRYQARACPGFAEGTAFCQHRWNTHGPDACIRCTRCHLSMPCRRRCSAQLACAWGEPGPGGGAGRSPGLSGPQMYEIPRPAVVKWVHMDTRGRH
jgi:hypothetical protein